MATSSKKQISMDKVDTDEVKAVEEAEKAEKPQEMNLNLDKKVEKDVKMSDPKVDANAKPEEVKAEKVEPVLNSYNGSAIGFKAQIIIERAGPGAKKYLPNRVR